MPYIQTVVTAGRIKEIYKTYSSRYGKKGIARGKNYQPTPSEMQKLNRDYAERKLGWLIAENFGPGDLHTVLTYKLDQRPTVEESKKRLSGFLRVLRKYFAKMGKELKYIAVTEYKNKAIHHHLLINSMDIRDLSTLWKYGRTMCTCLDDSGQYSQLAAYLIKETDKTFRDKKNRPSGKRWNASKNLRPPKIQKTVIQSKRWSAVPKPLKGYQLEGQPINRICDFTGREYQFYRMIRKC